MADALTPVLSLVKPEVGASRDTWGNKLNANMDTIDGIPATVAATSAFAAYNVKSTFVDADTISGFDSAASNAKSKWTWAVFKEAARAFVVGFANVFTARQSIQSGTGGNNGIAHTGFTNGELLVNNPSPNTGAISIAFAKNGWGAYFGIDTDNQWKVGGWSMGAVSYKIMHEGADLLSLQANAFIRQFAVGAETPSASFTPDVDGGVANMRAFTAPAGAWTFNAPAGNNYTLIYRIINPGSVSTVTFAGFNKVSGDAPPTSAGGVYMLYITRLNGTTTVFVDMVSGT